MLEYKKFDITDSSYEYLSNDLSAFQWVLVSSSTTEHLKNVSAVTYNGITSVSGKRVSVTHLTFSRETTIENYETYQMLSNRYISDYQLLRPLPSKAAFFGFIILTIFFLVMGIGCYGINQYCVSARGFSVDPVVTMATIFMITGGVCALISILLGVNHSNKTKEVNSFNAQKRKEMKEYVDKARQIQASPAIQDEPRLTSPSLENSTKETMASVSKADDYTDELIKLKKLLDAGIITQEEFDAKKKQILGLLD